MYNKLGYGFLEKVYENALSLELKSNGLQINKQLPIEIFYFESQVGKYFADIVVENKVIIEIKTEENIHPAHEAQLLNYLKATEIDVGLLLNFGKQPQFKRMIFENNWSPPE